MKLSKVIERSLEDGNKFFMTPITSQKFNLYTTGVNMPECWQRGKFLASHIAFEEEANTDEYPYVESHDLKRCYLSDKRGNIIGRSHSICVDTTWYKGEDYREELHSIWQDIDNESEDQSDLFFHKWVQKLPKENEAIIFVKGIYLEPKYIGKGIGTWFFGATIENAIEFGQKNITVALIVSPEDLAEDKNEDPEIINLGKREGFDYKAASEKLLSFYAKSFKELSLSSAFKDCKTDYRVDTGIKSAAAIIVWTVKGR